MDPELSRKLSEAGRKGGKARVKKGFATNRKLASEAGKKGNHTKQRKALLRSRANDPSVAVEE